MLTIYKDINANAIFIEDANGVQFLNSLQASASGDNVTVLDLARDIEIVTETHYSEFEDQAGATYGSNAVEVVNALNTIFQTAGTPTGSAPTITSSLTIALVEGQTVNYELTADFGVGYEWDLSNVAGITTVEGNVRKLVGGSSLSAGTYNIPVKAINYNGEDSDTIVLTVSTPPFANTKSVQFSNQDWLGANAGILQNVLGRSSNGSGSSDAWTMQMLYKPSATSQGQTILYYGDNDAANGGCIQVMQISSGNNYLLRLKYGSNNNNLRLQTSNGSLVANTWVHIIISYDGGTTGSASGSLNDYYGRFKIYLDGVLQTTNNSQSNFGWSGSVDPDNWRVGRFTSGTYMRNNSKVDELNIWDSDQSSNASELYNNGVVFDTMTLTDQPVHRWRMGDGDTFPYLFDTGSAANCIFIMNNMTAANIVSDVPS